MVITTTHRYQMWNAFSCMLYRIRPGQQRYKISSHIFEIIKSEGSKIKSINFAGENNPMYGKTGINSPLFGVKKSAEHISNLSKSHKGHVRTVESKAKQSAAMKGRKQSQEHISKRIRAGRKHSPETIAKIKAARANQKNVRGIIQGELKFQD